ncbi:hypothetical protein [Novosphingobium rosa]|uniref:hypothetical protein n=1 Tax=Novosphingobium rosa TaxID=76978 RepID=UPI000B2FEE2C|nr:hypothetical protein [Novosphingobium rosa]
MIRLSMIRLSPKFLIGAAALSLAGACAAQAATAKLHTMLVNLPDGSVAQVSYAGDVAPRIAIQPIDARQDAAMPLDQANMAMADPFAQMALMSAMMDRQADAMMQQASAMQQAAAHGAVPGMTMTGTGKMPEGVQMTYVSTTTDANGCTRTTSYSSDGSQAAPKVTEAASHGCEAKPVAPSGPAQREAPVSPDRKV